MNAELHEDESKDEQDDGREKAGSRLIRFRQTHERENEKPTSLTLTTAEIEAIVG